MYSYKNAENRYFTKYLRYRYRILYLVFRTWFRYQRGQCLCKGKRKKDTSCSGYSECIKSRKAGIYLCNSKAFCLTCISNNLFHRRRIVEIRGWAETKTKVCARTEISVFAFGLQEIPAYRLKLPGRKQKELFSLHLFQKVKTKSWLYFRKGNSTFCFHFLK